MQRVERGLPGGVGVAESVIFAESLKSAQSSGSGNASASPFGVAGSELGKASRFWQNQLTGDECCSRGGMRTVR